MSDVRKEMKIVSLIPIIKNGWTLKISSNNYDESVLVVAANYTLGYVTCKCFSDPFVAREWLNNLAFNSRKDKSKN